MVYSPEPMEDRGKQQDDLGGLEEKVDELEKLTDSFDDVPEEDLIGTLGEAVELLAEINARIEARLETAGDESREIGALLGQVDFGPFVLSSGERSSFYVDKYLFSTEPNLLRDVADALATAIPGGVERLAGVELGAVPLVVATALATGLPYVIVRKTAKEHGSSAGRSIEGNLEKGERVALVEDVVTTGTQAVRAARSLEETGSEVVMIVAVLDRREENGEELGGFPFRSLLRMDDLRVVKRH